MILARLNLVWKCAIFNNLFYRQICVLKIQKKNLLQNYVLSIDCCNYHENFFFLILRWFFFGKISKSKELPGPSVSEDTIPESSLYSDTSKLLLKNAVVYYEGLLYENNLIASESSPIIPEDAISIGEVLYNTTLEILNEKN